MNRALRPVPEIPEGYVPLESAEPWHPGTSEVDPSAPEPKRRNGHANAHAASEIVAFDERNPPLAGDAGAPSEDVADLNWFSAADLAGKPVPARGWLVRDMIPDRTVTLLGGDGGTGKSQIALQLIVATEIGAEWLGQLPEQGPVVFASAEDDRDELHRRLSDIAASHGVSLADLPGLHLASLAGRDAVMGVPDKAGVVRQTAVWRGLVAKVEQVKPRLVVIDTLADIFAGNENARAEARQFIGQLRGLAISHNCAVLLLNHPSLSGMASGAGTSGSTAWSNSVRSRIYFERAKGDDGIEVDPDLRILKVMKANYGPVGMELRLRWTKGVFRLDGQSAGAFDKLAADAKAERVFLDLLALLTLQGRDVSSKTSSAYAPSVFAGHPNAESIGKQAFARAMERLFSANRIRVETFGPPSHRRSKLIISYREGAED
jgi:RecA-family ATPase